MYITVSVPQH